MEKEQAKSVHGVSLAKHPGPLRIYWGDSGKTRLEIGSREELSCLRPAPDLLHLPPASLCSSAPPVSPCLPRPPLSRYHSQTLLFSPLESSLLKGRKDQSGFNDFVGSRYRERLHHHQGHRTTRGRAQNSSKSLVECVCVCLVVEMLTYTASARQTCRLNGRREAPCSQNARVKQDEEA